MIWRRKKVGDPQSAPGADRFDQIATDLLNAAEINFDSASQLQQALVATFLFGMLYAEGMATALSAREIRDIASITYQNVLHYTPEAAEQAIQQCVDATNPRGHDTMNAILHRGIDGHRQYIAGDLIELRSNLISILEHFAERSN